MEPLTPRQEKVLAFVADYVRRKGFAPSVREVAAAMKIGTPKGAADHLKALERKGYIEREAGRPRAMRVSGGQGIPVVGRIAAGSPILAAENLEGTVPAEPSAFGGGELFAVRVRGDSMIGDHILDGDLAVIRRQTRVEQGEIAAVLLGDEATLKRVYVRSGGVELKASNPAYRPIRAGEEARVLGRFVGLIRT